MDLSLLPMLLRVVGSCNRSPHSMALLQSALPLVQSLVADASCRHHAGMGSAIGERQVESEVFAWFDASCESTIPRSAPYH